MAVKKKSGKRIAGTADRVRSGVTNALMAGSKPGRGRETVGTMRGANMDRYLSDIENGGRKRK